MRLTILLLLLSYLSYSQITYTNGDLQYQEVIEYPGQSKEQVYSSVKKWINVTYSNPKEVISSDLKNEQIKGTGIGLHIITFNALSKISLKYNFLIEIKEGKARVTYTSLHVLDSRYPFKAYTYKGSKQKTSKAAIRMTDEANSYLSSLTKSMIVQPNNENW